VQAKLAANAVDRQVRLKGSPAILTGRIFDDRGSRMSPTHSNKLGARYRYYVSHAVLQKRKADAGSVARLPAPKVETLVLDGLRGAGYSITSSARASSDGGTVRPSALAVLRLITSSNFVGCSKGRPEGFAPLIILST
jgi:hypothetical protein